MNHLTPSLTLTPNASAAAPLTMSSREIAELTGKEHRNICRDIRSMLEALGLGVLSFEQTRIEPQNGQMYACFSLPKDLTITLVTGYSIPLRHRVVTRWMELEQQTLALKPTKFHSKFVRGHHEVLSLPIPPCTPVAVRD